MEGTLSSSLCQVGCRIASCTLGWSFLVDILAPVTAVGFPGQSCDKARGTQASSLWWGCQQNGA